MWWILIVIVVVAFGPTQAIPPTNCSSRNTESTGISGGVCKADYGSRFNIDSKELTGTTCVDRNRCISKIVTSRLKQALDKMKQDFQQLQDLIEQEVPSAAEIEPIGSLWKSSSLNVHRIYPNEQKSDSGKLAGFYGDPLLNSNVADPLVQDRQGRTFFNSHPSLFGGCQPRNNYDNASNKKSPDTFSSRIGHETPNDSKQYQREPFSEFSPKTAVEQQRVLADIRVDPEIEPNRVGSGESPENKGKFSEPEGAVPPIGLNPPNFTY